jgi:hypothetical protein
MIIFALVLALLAMPTTPIEVTAVQFPARGKATLSLGGKSKASVERGGTVSKTSIEIEGIRTPQSVRAGMNCYVVWAISPEGTFENLGELEISGGKATLEATTRFDRFAILVTVEPHYMVDTPGSAVVYKNESARDFPGVPLTIDVGKYDYPALPESPPGVPALVMEARAAISIATSVQADKRAESEFRQARVALDTMEELVRRTSAPDVVSAAAHAAIRRAQTATTVARQSVR